MTVVQGTASNAAPAGDSGAGSSTTRRLLWAGALAGPVFLGLSAIQIATRAGFDLTRHPLSALALGSMGWVQIVNFVVTGLAAAAASVGLRRSLTEGVGRTAVPVLVGIWGAALTIAGVVVTDGAFGFPQGAPAGMPESLGVHAIVHGLCAMVAFGALAVAAVILARRAASQRRVLLASVLAGAAVAVLALSMAPDTDSASLRYAATAVIGWSLVSALAASRLPAAASR